MKEVLEFETEKEAKEYVLREFQTFSKNLGDSPFNMTDSGISKTIIVDFMGYTIYFHSFWNVVTVIVAKGNRMVASIDNLEGITKLIIHEIRKDYANNHITDL